MMLTNIGPGYRKNQLERMNINVDEYNGKASGLVNVRYQKYQLFSTNEFWNNIGCLVSDPTFILGVTRLWEKEESQKIGLNNRNRRSISMKVDLYGVFLSYIICCLLFYFITILAPFFARFILSLSLGERSSGSINQKDSSRKRKRIHMNGGGKFWSSVNSMRHA